MGRKKFRFGADFKLGLFWTQNGASSAQDECGQMEGWGTNSRRNAIHLEKGSVESTHKVPTSHYHTKHRTDGRCHRGPPVALFTVCSHEEARNMQSAAAHSATR